MPFDPNNITGMMNKLPPEIAGAFMAMFIAVIRVIYDKEETRPMRVILESLLCGALSLTASSGILAAGLEINWAIFVGGTIGYFGSAAVRGIALKLINRKIGE